MCFNKSFSRFGLGFFSVRTGVRTLVGENMTKTGVKRKSAASDPCVHGGGDDAVSSDGSVNSKNAQTPVQMICKLGDPHHLRKMETFH